MSLIEELDHLQISLHGVKNHINYEMDDGMESGPSGDGSHNKQRSSEEHQEPDHSLTKEITEGTEPKLPADDSEDDDTSGEDDSESSDEEEEEEERKAPVEMLGEFLIYVRTADWENAAKLCKMILIYEPNNLQALQFQSVIAEKVQVEKDLAEMSSSSEEESTDEEESEDDEEGDAEKSEDSNKEDDESDEEPQRPQSEMKNRLLFPSDNKIWKP